MAIPRSFAGTRLTTRPSMTIEPDVTDSRPAIMRSKVDLPHPEGPTSTTNACCSIASSIPCRTSSEPKLFRRSWSSTSGVLIERTPSVEFAGGRLASRTRASYFTAPDTMLSTTRRSSRR